MNVPPAQRIGLTSPIVVTPPAPPSPPAAPSPIGGTAPATGAAGPSSFSSALQSALASPTTSAVAPGGPVPSALPPVAAPASGGAAFAPGDAAGTPDGAPAPAGSYPGLTGDLDADPAVLSRLSRMATERGQSWTVTSGLRTDAEQAALYADRASNPYPVAAPGKSIHRTGEGADVTIDGRAIQDVIPVGELRAAGLEPLVGDAVHVQLAGTLR